LAAGADLPFVHELRADGLQVVQTRVDPMHARMVGDVARGDVKRRDTGRNQVRDFDEEPEDAVEQRPDESLSHDKCGKCDKCG
jgi:hypothetical protein